MDGTSRHPLSQADATAPPVQDGEHVGNEPKLTADQNQHDQPQDQQVQMDLDERIIKDQPMITFEKSIDYAALIDIDEIQGSKSSQRTKIEQTLKEYNIPYNKDLGVTQFQKKVKVTFRNKDAYEQFLKAELIVRE